MKGQFTIVMLVTMRPAMTVSKPQMFANQSQHQGSIQIIRKNPDNFATGLQESKKWMHLRFDIGVIANFVVFFAQY
jgi:hypothetical protein